MSRKTKEQLKHNFAALTEYIRDTCSSDYKEQAEVLGISPYQISRWRTAGEAGHPKESHFEALERAYGITRQEWMMNTANVNVLVKRLQDELQSTKEEIKGMKAEIELVKENQKLLSGYVTRDMTTDLDEYRNIAKRNSNKDQD